MRKILLFIIAGSLCGADVEEKETVRQNFPAPRVVEVDTVDGSIRVSGFAGSEVQMVVEKTFRASTRERIEEARRDVKLDISQKGDALVLYVDGPFRCNCDCDGCTGTRWSWRDRDYTVRHDFELKVPQQTVLRLRTVNRGDIHVENTSGDFDLKNVNGRIEMKEVSGSGLVRTVNGRVEALFRENPRSASSFVTLNGEVKVLFRPNFSADLQFKTFNGGVYTDFPVTYSPVASPAPERRNGKFVYRSNRYSGARVGQGGPEMKFETFNGSIRILQREN